MNIRARRRAMPALLARWLTVLAASVGLATLAACSSASVPAQSGVKYADAVTQASMAYVQVNWRGWVVASRDIDVSANEYFAKGTYGPFTAVTSCSGFVASATGDVVTAGHCVDASSVYGGKGAILAAMMARWHHANGSPLTPAEQVSQAQILAANASVEGSVSGGPVDRTVRVSVPAVSSKLHTANVTDVQPFTQGDVGLLHVTGITAPPLTVAQATPQNGDSVVAAGYPGDVAAVVDSSTPASYVDGTVSGTQTVNGTPFTQISAQVSAGMSGGPVVTMAGQVVGTVSWAPNGTTSANFMTDVGAIRSILAGNGVRNALTPAERLFRQGLAYYFAHRYHEAVVQFDKALAIQPGLALVSDYRQKAVAAYPNDVNPPGGGMPAWAYAVIGAAILLLAGGTGLVLLRRRRGGAQPAVQAAAPPPAAPLPTVTTPTVTTPTAPAPATRLAPVPGSLDGPPLTKPGEQAVRDETAAEDEQHYCPNCGARHEATAHYCEQCGQPFPAGLPAPHGRGEGVGP